MIQWMLDGATVPACIHISAVFTHTGQLHDCWRYELLFSGK